MHQPISRKAELYKPRNGEAGTETCRVVKPSSVKTKEPPSPCGFTYGIAVYGPVCTVVWEGRAGNRSPYPDYPGDNQTRALALLSSRGFLRLALTSHAARAAQDDRTRNNLV